MDKKDLPVRYGRKEMAEIYGISVQTIDNLTKQGAPHFRVGRKVIFDPVKFEAWAENWEM